MKRIIRQIGIILNLWRLAIPIYMFKYNKTFREKIEKDIGRLHFPDEIKNIYNKFCYSILYFPTFRNILYLRMNNKKILSNITKIFIPKKNDLEISGNIKGGIVVYHGQSSVIHCVSAGENFSVYQNVTVGRNKEHYSSDGNDKPVIGNNVSLYPGSVVAGGIKIGNNVEIGANCVVLKDIPDNCLVVGNPAVIKRKDGKKVHIDLMN